MGGGGRNAEKTFTGTLKMLEVHHPLFCGGEVCSVLKPIIHKAFKWTKIEIYCYLRYLLRRFDFTKRHFSNLQLKSKVGNAKAFALSELPMKYA